MIANREQYLQCPYCTNHIGGHKIRVPKTVGKHRVKIINNETLIFKCGKCSAVFKMKTDGKLYLWKTMNKIERALFKNIIYKGGIKKDEKNI